MEQPRTLLIVDDEPDVCILLRQMLRHQFYPIEYAHNLSDALALTQNFAPDVILLDNNLPDGYGVEHIARFKILLPNAQIVLLSAMDIQQSAVEAGADWFLSKPFDSHQLEQLMLNVRA